VSISPWFKTALHVAHSAFWKGTRLVLLVWGLFNGFGLGLVGQVQRVKQRISRRVPRISGSLSS
jgi:hypothetical protein